MRLSYKNTTNNLPYIPAGVIGLYQEGGEMVMSEEAMETESNPAEELLMMAQQALESQDPEMAFGVCQMLIEMMSPEQETSEEMEEETEME